MKRFLHIFIRVLVVPGMVFAYVMLPELHDLVDRAEVICIGKVVTKSLLEKRGSHAPVKAEILPERVLKGSLAVAEKRPITVFTAQTVFSPDGFIEDPIPPFPAEDSRVLLFLRKDGEAYLPVGTRSGVYLLRPGRPLDPVALFSLADVETMLAKPAQDH
jgi:hypothetical protein